MARGRVKQKTNHEKKQDLAALERRLWGAADELRANSKLKASEYSIPVLGLIFLRYADHRFTAAQERLTKKRTGRRRIGKTDYHAKGVLYLAQKARFQNLLTLPHVSLLNVNVGDAELAPADGFLVLRELPNDFFEEWDRLVPLA